MIASLFPQTDEAPFLDANEIVEILTAEFPNCLVDWEKANVKLKDELKQLENLGTPDSVMKGHKHLLDKTVYIEVYVKRNPRVGVYFFAYPDSPLDLISISDLQTEDYSDQVEELVAAIARSLHYEFEMNTNQ